MSGGQQTGRRVRIADLLITAGLAVVFSTALLTAMSWSFRAALFPRLVAGFGIGIAVLLLVTLIVRRPADDADQSDQDGPGELEYAFATAGRTAWLQNLGWLAGFFTFLYVLGLLVTAPLFTLLYLRFAARASWPLCIGYAAAIGILLYLAFVQALDLPVPEGTLW